jgi:hypothetical protein
MTGSPYITIPDPGATQASLSAAVQALKHDVNLLIVNSQTDEQTLNLVGAKVFALQQASIAFKDAPADGNAYGRRNATWVKVLSPNDNLLTIVIPANFVDDLHAKAGGVPVGGIYRNGSQLMVRVV